MLRVNTNPLVIGVIRVIEDQITTLPPYNAHIRVIIAHFFDPICGDDHPYITRIRLPRKESRALAVCLQQYLRRRMHMLAPHRHVLTQHPLFADEGTSHRTRQDHGRGAAGARTDTACAPGSAAGPARAVRPARQPGPDLVSCPAGLGCETPGGAGAAAFPGQSRHRPGVHGCGVSPVSAQLRAEQRPGQDHGNTTGSTCLVALGYSYRSEHGRYLRFFRQAGGAQAGVHLVPGAGRGSQG